MNKIVLIGFIVMLLFQGCTHLSLEDQVIKSNKKVFEAEDSMILHALHSEEQKDYQNASKLFQQLYEESGKKEYLYRSLQNLLYLKHFDEIVTKIDDISKNKIVDYHLTRLKVLTLVQQHKVDEAKELSIQLLEKSKAVKDYILVSEILTELHEYDLAVKYLESAYREKYDENILDKMSIILYVNLKRKKDAIAYLETHTRVHGYSELTCKRLISIYSNENNLEGLLSTYLKYYQIKPTQEISKKIIQLYGYKKEYNKIIHFLEGSNSDDEVLLELYIASKNYQKAYPLANKLYEKTGDVKYFGESIIYQYESNLNNLNETILGEIAKKFEILLALDDSSYLLNYYGYILIDHDIDVQKGIGYIQQALQREPDSIYYLDSLAWGHYKNGACGDSLKVMNKILAMDGEKDPEVLKHYKIIKQCKGKND